MAKRHGKYKISKKEAALIAVDAGSYDTGPITVSGTLLASGLITGQAGLALDNLTIADASGNLAINTNKFTIAGATGNTAIAGTLEVTGNCGFYGESAVAQYATEGTTAGFTAGSGTAANDDSTFTGNTGTKAYTVGDIVLALKGLGLIDS